jgi:MFS family permease
MTSPTNSQTRANPTYGRVILAAACAIVTVGMGALFSLSVFVKPLEETMGWSRSRVSTIALLNWVIMGGGSLFWGYLSDRIGTRIVALAGGLILGTGLVLSSRATEIWQFYLSFGLLVGLAGSAFYVPLTSTVTRWFIANRGLAVGIVNAGIGLGILIVPPFSSWLISTFDWRTTMLILGGLAWLVVVPGALIVKNHPNDGAGAADSRRRAVPRSGAEFTAGEALRSFPLWVLAVTHFACCAAHSGPIFHMVSYAIDQGISHVAAAGAFGVSGLASVIGRLGLSALGDRLGAKRVLVATLIGQAVMILAYLPAEGLATFYVLGLFFGVTYGGVMPLYPIVTREYFGEKVMGTAYGAVFFISALGMGAGAFAGGWFYDVFGHYGWLYVSAFAMGGMATLLAVTVRPPRPERASAELASPALSP